MAVLDVADRSPAAHTGGESVDYHSQRIPSEIVLEGCLVGPGERVILRSMTWQDYGPVREMLPKVSRCSRTFDEKTVKSMIAMPTFFPFVFEWCGPPPVRKIIGYAEVHRLPHLGRGMDGRLEKVLVLEEWRGKKIAQVGCKKILELLEGDLLCGRCDLTVEKPDAMTVYRKLGFTPVDTNVWRRFF